METEYAVALIPVGAAYVAWLTNRVLKLAETQAATVAKLDMVVVRQDSQNVRQDSQEMRIDTLLNSR